MNWLSLDKDTILSGVDGNGNRYLSQFLADYKRIFNPSEINAGCIRCLDDYYIKMTKYLAMSTNKNSKKNSGYLLKKKYEGIPMAFGSRKLVYNHTLTDEIAESMLKNHPRGKDLFENIPAKSQDKGTGAASTNTEPIKELLKLSRNDLNAQALELGIENPEELANKDAVANAILESQDKGTGEEE